MERCYQVMFKFYREGTRSSTDIMNEVNDRALQYGCEIDVKSAQAMLDHPFLMMAIFGTKLNLYRYLTQEKKLTDLSAISAILDGEVFEDRVPTMKDRVVDVFKKE